MNVLKYRQKASQDQSLTEPNEGQGASGPTSLNSGSHRSSKLERDVYFEITCIGHNDSARINGESITTGTDPERRTLQGSIGLLNDNDGHTVSFRKLRIRELP